MAGRLPRLLPSGSGSSDFLYILLWIQMAQTFFVYPKNQIFFSLLGKNILGTYLFSVKSRLLPGYLSPWKHRFSIYLMRPLSFPQLYVYLAFHSLLYSIDTRQTLLPAFFFAFYLPVSLCKYSQECTDNPNYQEY